MMRFLPVNKREKYAADFERLRQTHGMSIAEYEEQFTNLSRYANHLVSAKTIRARRFVRGLTDPLFTNLLPMVGRMSYVEIVDTTYSLEIGREERRAAKESGKKQKMKGTFSGGSSSEGTQGYSGRRQAPSGEAASSGPVSMNVSALGSQAGSMS